MATTYMSFKKAKCCSSKVFATDLIVDIEALAEKTKKMISQYRHIKESKEFVAGEFVHLY